MSDLPYPLTSYENRPTVDISVLIIVTHVQKKTHRQINENSWNAMNNLVGVDTYITIFAYT